MKCKVEELVTTARNHGKATAGSGGAWRAEAISPTQVSVWHYDTLMVTWWRTGRPGRPGQVFYRHYDPLERWSVSDRQGVNSILRYEGFNARYDQLWPDIPVPEILEGDPAILEEGESLDEWEKFDPPVHVNDTVM